MKHTKEYAEKVADEYVKGLVSDGYDLDDYSSRDLIKIGYLKAVEECNVVGLIEALKMYLNAGHKEARRLASIKAKEELKKAVVE